MDVLLVIRHGKAERDSPTGRDRDRPLNARGMKQARWLGEQLANSDRLRPQRLLSSHYVRTMQTAEAIGEVLGIEHEPEERLSLDFGVADTIEVALEAFSDQVPSVVAVVGHQPAMERVIATLTAGPTSIGPRVRTGTCFILEREHAEAHWSLVGELRRAD